jgi:MFS-type transporter involved in bile tolerance (Atg22 family)
MVVDLTTDVNIGTFTGMYYLFSTLAAILGPIMYGWIIQLSNNEYRGLMLLSPLFMIGAFISMAGVRKGEAKPVHEANAS